MKPPFALKLEARNAKIDFNNDCNFNKKKGARYVLDTYTRYAFTRPKVFSSFLKTKQKSTVNSLILHY
jgi:hypothetical protein